MNDLSNISPDMDLTDLPELLAELMRAKQEARNLRIASLQQVFVTRRDKAVKDRLASGIERVWLDAEEAYLGIDDENRHEFVGSRWTKPTTMQGPVTAQDASRTNSSKQIRSTAYVRMTSRYVDAGSAKVAEIALPIDGKAFSFAPTPLPEFVDKMESMAPVRHPETGQPLPNPDYKPASDPTAGGNPANPPPQPTAASAAVKEYLTEADLAKEAMDRATDQAKKAETRIYDWMVESHYPAEMRKVIFDAARIGVGVLKGPFPEIAIGRAVTRGPDGKGKPTLKIVEKIVPKYRWVDPWMLYPDGGCGENIQRGGAMFELDFVSEKTLEEMKLNPAYLKDALDLVIKQGPTKQDVYIDRPSLKGTVVDDGRFSVWYGYMILTREEVETCLEMGVDPQVTGVPSDTKDIESLHCIVTVINDTIVRVTVNPLETGDFPYHVMPWSRRANYWAGVGVAEQIRTPQRMVNAATRSRLVNASKSAGSQIVVDRSCVEPADGLWTIYPDKLWYKNADAVVDDVRKAFETFTFPNVQEAMMKIIEYGFKIAEDCSNIPLISQGQSGKQTPDTFGGQMLQDNNANQLLRAIGYALDDHITEPVVNQSYEWLLLDPDVPDDEKGDYKINAHGSAAMVERFIQTQAIATMLGNLAANPVYGIDPKKYAEEFLKSQRLDARNFKYSKEDQARIDSQPPPPAPAVQAAQLRAQSAENIAQLTNQTRAQIEQQRTQAELQRSQADMDRDTAYNQSLAERDRIQAEAAKEELMLRRELALLEYANKKDITLEQIKADLAKATMNETTKRALAQAELEMAAKQAELERTHDKGKHNAELRIDTNPISDRPDTTPSLVRDEVSTNLTP